MFTLRQLTPWTNLAKAQWHWPLALTSVLLAGSLVFAVLGWKTQGLNERMRSSVQMVSDKSSESPTSVGEDAPIISAPITAYNDDLNTLYRLAQLSRLNVSNTSFRQDAATPAPYVLRLVAIKASDDYATIKRFISRLLQQLPNASISEIRMERKGSADSTNLIALEIALLYDASITAGTTSTGDFQKSTHAASDNVTLKEHAK